MKEALSTLNIYMRIMGGPVMRLLIYVAIASLTSLMNDFSKYTSLDQIGQITWIMIFINFALQGLIAWRAYIDGSYPRAIEKLEEGKLLAKKQEDLINRNQNKADDTLLNG
jgi:hypothetical protein